MNVYRQTAVLSTMKNIVHSKNSQKIIFNANRTVSYKNKFILRRHCVLRFIVSVWHTRNIEKWRFVLMTLWATEFWV